jgi:hypothetical protein
LARREKHGHREAAERDDDTRVDSRDLALKVIAASGQFFRQRVAVSGGRHFTTLVMNTSPRVRPALASNSLRNYRLNPQMAVLFVFIKSGPSPINMICASAGPSPGTDSLRLECRSHC